MTRNGDTGQSRDLNERIRERVTVRMVDRGWEPNAYAKLADVAGYDRRQVRKYLIGKTERIPAEFVAALELGGFASARWLLTGEGSAAPIAPSHAEQIVEQIRRILRPLSGVEDSRNLLRATEKGEEGTA